MAKRATPEPTTFSKKVVAEVEKAVRESGIPISDILTKSEMSRNYFYIRMRLERPFDTNDISKLASALGIDPMALLMKAAKAADAEHAAEKE